MANMYTKIPKEWRNFDGNVTIQELNDLLVRLHILSIFVISVLMVVGVIGNILSIYVFTIRYESSTHRYFILWLAWIDLIACSVGKPLLIMSMLNPYMFPSDSACKTGRFLNVFPVVSSGFIVVAIAWERHRRIFYPFAKTSSSRKAMIICIVANICGFIVAIPALLVYGKSEIDTGVNNITGYECFIDPSYKDTLFPRVYFITQFAVALACIIVLVILYSRTGIKIWTHMKARTESESSSHHSIPSSSVKSVGKKSPRLLSVNEVSNVCHSISNRSDGMVFSNKRESGMSNPYLDADNAHNLDRSNNRTEQQTEQHLMSPNLKNTLITIEYSSAVEDSTNSQQLTTIKVPKHKRRLNRQSTRHRIERAANESEKTDEHSMATKQVTKMFFLITLVFVISFIPHLILLMTIAVYPGIIDVLSPTGVVFYTLFFRSFVINNMANPIIYSFCDRRFRSECASAVTTVITCGRYGY